MFSLIVVSNDLTFLTNNFEYFKTTLGGIKNDLQVNQFQNIKGGVPSTLLIAEKSEYHIKNFEQ